MFFPPATTKQTEAIIQANPMQSRGVSTSPKTVIPKNIAVAGSRTPSIAVGVEPIS